MQSSRLFGNWVPPDSVVQRPERLEPPQEEPQSWVCGGTAHFLPRERARASFDTMALTFVLDGGPKATARRRWIWASGEAYDNSSNYFKSRQEIVAQHVERFIGVHKKFADEGFQPSMGDIMQMQNVAKNAGAFGLHFGAFCNTVASQGTMEQMMEWGLPGYQMKITGCLAQTELGHGSNVRGLQTIAEYDKERKEFVLNTPTLQAMKWWPGGLGKTATHCLVYANIIIDTVEYGFHCFMMQLRDQNHKPMPGVEVGEVGPKIGDNGTETGFLRMKDVRIPRTWLMMKNQEVTDDGVYVNKVKKSKSGGSNKRQYLTMLSIRAGLVSGAGYRLAQGVTVATRYSCVRHQGFKDTTNEGARNAPERCVMDYQNQQYRLLKQLSVAYAFTFTGKSIMDRMEYLQKNIDSDPAAADNLPELHAISSGLKALTTFEGAQGLEDCRKCCGGHGVLQIGGIAQMANDYVTYNTAEGDRIVLELQSGRYLMKAVREARNGQPVAGLCGYLSGIASASFDLGAEMYCDATKPRDFEDLDVLLRLFRGRALASVLDAESKYQSLVQGGCDHDAAWNECAVDIVLSSRAHCYYTILVNFVGAVRGIQDEAVRVVLTAVCALFATINMCEDLGSFELTRSQKRAVRDAMLGLLPVVRADVVPLMDAFEFPDNVLNSALGRHDGNVYESLYAGAKASPLNNSDPFEGYTEHLRPHLDLDFIAEKAKIQKSIYTGQIVGTSKL